MKTSRQLFLDYDLARTDDVQQPLTDTRLAEIAARCERATTGPWLVAVGEEVGHNWLVCGSSRDDDNAGRMWCVETDSIHASDVDGDARDDAAFIAHARTDIPTLLVEIERLRGLLAKGWIR